MAAGRKITIRGKKSNYPAKTILENIRLYFNVFQSSNFDLLVPEEKEKELCVVKLQFVTEITNKTLCINPTLETEKMECRNWCCCCACAGFLTFSRYPYSECVPQAASYGNFNVFLNLNAAVAI